MIKSGISQIGGKFKLRKRLLKLTPRHDFFLSLFLGAGHYELNKPRCQYECFNDLDSQFINYLIIISRNPEEFNQMKKGIFGLVSQEIVNRIVNREIKPKNNIERAYFFYYLNKTCYSKTNYRGIVLPTSSKKINIEHYDGDLWYSFLEQKFGEDPKYQDYLEWVKQAEKLSRKSSHYKGINPKITRPYSNNDLGLLTPIDPKAIERLRYVNLTCYDFRHVYKMFYKAYHKRKKLSVECFIYEDPPYPSTEKYYGNMFKPENHQDLINLNLDSPFNIMQSIGGDCQFYLDAYKDAGWFIKPVKTKYSLDANTQDEITEYVCMNYNINKLPIMIMDFQKDIRSFH